MGLGLLLQSSENRGAKRRSTAGSLVLADAKRPRHRLQPAHLGEDVGDLHEVLRSFNDFAVRRGHSG